MSRASVLWLIKGLDRGGAERLLTLMAPRIDRQRFQVEIAYLLPGADGFVPELEAAGIPTVCLGARGTVSMGWPRALRRLLRQRRYAVVHTHSPLPAAVARLLARRPTRLLHTEHNMWGVYRWPTFVANAVTYGRNDVVIAVSDGVADSIERPWWTQLGPAPPVESLLHGVDPDRAFRGPEARARARSSLGIDERTPVVGKVANLSPKKDHRGVLAAFEHVRAQFPDVRLLLIGSGPLEDDLRAHVAERDLADHVRFLGSRDDVSELLPALDVFLLGSRYEGLPISLLEAMAAEVACVATSVGGIPEVIEDRVTGRLAPPGDPTRLAAALIETLRDPAAQASMARAGRRLVADRFSINRAVERTEELYAQLLGAPEPA